MSYTVSEVDSNTTRGSNHSSAVLNIYEPWEYDHRTNSSIASVASDRRSRATLDSEATSHGRVSRTPNLPIHSHQRLRHGHPRAPGNLIQRTDEYRPENSRLNSRYTPGPAPTTRPSSDYRIRTEHARSGRSLLGIIFGTGALAGAPTDSGNGSRHRSSQTTPSRWDACRPRRTHGNGHGYHGHTHAHAYGHGHGHRHQPRRDPAPAHPRSSYSYQPAPRQHRDAAYARHLQRVDRHRERRDRHNQRVPTGHRW